MSTCVFNYKSLPGSRFPINIPKNYFSFVDTNVKCRIISNPNFWGNQILNLQIGKDNYKIKLPENLLFPEKEQEKLLKKSVLMEMIRDKNVDVIKLFLSYIPKFIINCSLIKLDSLEDSIIRELINFRNMFTQYKLLSSLNGIYYELKIDIPTKLLKEIKKYYEDYDYSVEYTGFSDQKNLNNGLRIRFGKNLGIGIFVRVDNELLIKDFENKGDELILNDIKKYSICNKKDIDNEKIISIRFIFLSQFYIDKRNEYEFNECLKIIKEKKQKEIKQIKEQKQIKKQKKQIKQKIENKKDIDIEEFLEEYNNLDNNSSKKKKKKKKKKKVNNEKILQTKLLNKEKEKKIKQKQIQKQQQKSKKILLFSKEIQKKKLKIIFYAINSYKTMSKRMNKKIIKKFNKIFYKKIFFNAIKKIFNKNKKLKNNEINNMTSEDINVNIIPEKFNNNLQIVEAKEIRELKDSGVIEHHHYYHNEEQKVYELSNIVNQQQTQLFLQQQQLIEQHQIINQQIAYQQMYPSMFPQMYHPMYQPMYQPMYPQMYHPMYQPMYQPVNYSQEANDDC